MTGNPTKQTRRFFAVIFLTMACCLAAWTGSALAAGNSRPAHQVRPKSAKAPVAKKRGFVRPRRKSIPRRKAAPSSSARLMEAILPARLELLNFRASSAYIIDPETNEVLLGKNAQAMLPIASLTKLMTGVVIADAQLPLDEQLTITDEDVDRLKNSGSRLNVGTVITRGQALHLALMSSENRAAHALARTYPGGEGAFVSAMNMKAREFGMGDTRFVEPTGLSSENRSTARDLAVLAVKATERPLLQKLSTSPGYELTLHGRTLQYVNSNRLVRTGQWTIDLQKTGYIREAGYNLLMSAELSGRKLIMVFLNSASGATRIRDAELVRRWLERQAMKVRTTAAAKN